MKAFFLSRLFREKLLLLGLVLLAAVTWLLSASRRTASFANEFRETTKLLASQRDWLAQQPQIEAAAKAAVMHLDPAKTFNGGRLQSEVEAIAKRTGVTNYSADNPQTESTSQFSVNSMQLQIRNVDWPALTGFYLELSKQAPYIVIDQFGIRVANLKHSVSMRVSSVEMAK